MTALKYFYGIAGLTTLANGLWMLVSPETWYGTLPAEVPDTGPLNVHFVRDSVLCTNSPAISGSAQVALARPSDAGCWMQDTGCKMRDTGYQIKR